MIDYTKTGSFIASMRKNQGLTQRQLAERLDISDKTVSKWETGRSTPDNSIMIELCEVLKISVNELLCGEKISGDVYIDRAEENLVNLMKEREQNAEDRRLAKAGTVIGFLLMIVMIVFMIFGFTKDGYKHVIRFFDPMSFFYVAGIPFLVLLISGMLPDFGRAFSICYKRNADISAHMAEEALTAVKTALYSLLLSGVLTFVTGFIISAASSQPDMETMLSNMGTAALTIFYGALFTLLLLPTAVRLKRLLIRM